MKKQQLSLIGGAVALLFIIYFFGNNVPPIEKKPVSSATHQDEAPLDINTILSASKRQLTPEQSAFVSRLESAVVRGSVKDQQISVYKQLANFWKDTVHLLLPYSYYTAEAAKLENSEKSLTFAAQFFAGNMRRQQEPVLKKWMALQAKELFEKALELNPASDSLKIGLGSCYLFGNISDNPMKGIALIREVAARDSSNMYAQFMLGMGGLVSGQLDLAIQRLLKVAKNEPQNAEAVLALADAFERKKDKANAILWYERGKELIGDPDFIKEINQRISLLKT
ncbi:MAG TPA: tetratricopeptide repeat protein [Flavitalea sp.]|nr:tetratricopeptide repeat protein [Flavitalea sp.]